jgi:hypothetical protein
MPKPRRPWTVSGHGPIEQIDENLWSVVGPVPGAPMQRRMCIVRRSDGQLLFFHAIPLDGDALAQVKSLGNPAFLVVGHDLHAIDAAAFGEKLGLRTYGPKQRDAQLRERLDLAGHLEDVPQDPAHDIQPVAGTKYGEPVLIVKSGGGRRANLMFCDVVQNNAKETTGLALRLAGFGGGPKVPIAMKLLLLNDKRAVRNHLARLADMPGLTRLLPCHGEVTTSGAATALRAAAARV